MSGQFMKSWLLARLVSLVWSQVSSLESTLKKGAFIFIFILANYHCNHIRTQVRAQTVASHRYQLTSDTKKETQQVQKVPDFRFGFIVF